MCRLLGFIFFWIAVGMIITLFIMDNVFLCVCIIITLIVVGKLPNTGKEVLLKWLNVQFAKKVLTLVMQ